MFGSQVPTARPNFDLSLIDQLIDNLMTYDAIIPISPITDTIKKIYNNPNWVNDTTKTLKKYTDRKIIVHNKFSKKNLDDLLKNNKENRL